MASQTHLTRRSGSANYYYRESVPPDIRQLLSVEGKLGPKDIWRSLGTPNIRTAKERLAGVRDAEHRHWAALRENSLTPSASRPDEDRVAAVIVRIYKHELENRLKKLKAASAGGSAAVEEFIERERTILHDATLKQMTGTGSAWSAPMTDAVIARLGWNLPKADANGDETAEYRELGEKVLQAIAEARRVTLEKLGGNLSAEPQSIIVKEAIRSTSHRPAPGQALMELFDRYAKQTVAEGRKKLDTVTQDKKTVEQFSNWIGKRSAKSIIKDDVREFRNLIMELPRKYNTLNGFRGLSLSEMAEKSGKENIPKRELRTIAKELSALSGFFSWLVSEGYANENPTTGLFPRFDKAKGRLPCYTIDQLNAAFSSPLFTGCDPRSGKEHLAGETHVRDWRYWLPLCAMFTGARTGELAQLRVADVRKEGDIWIFDLIDDDEATAATSLKSAASQRAVPTRIWPRLRNNRYTRFMMTPLFWLT